MVSIACRVSYVHVFVLLLTVFMSGKHLWRNRLARSAVNRKVAGSSPARCGLHFFFPFFPSILFQVTAAMDSGDSINRVKPSLGLAWADMVTVRLMLTREEGVENCGDIVQKVSKMTAVRLRHALSSLAHSNMVLNC